MDKRLGIVIPTSGNQFWWVKVDDMKHMIEKAKLASNGEDLCLSAKAHNQLIDRAFSELSKDAPLAQNETDSPQKVESSGESSTKITERPSAQPNPQGVGGITENKIKKELDKDYDKAGQANALWGESK